MKQGNEFLSYSPILHAIKTLAMLGHFIATEFAFCLYQKMFLCISVVRLRGEKSWKQF